MNWQIFTTIILIIIIGIGGFIWYKICEDNIRSQEIIHQNERVIDDVLDSCIDSLFSLISSLDNTIQNIEYRLESALQAKEETKGVDIIEEEQSDEVVITKEEDIIVPETVEDCPTGTCPAVTSVPRPVRQPIFRRR